MLFSPGVDEMLPTGMGWRREKPSAVYLSYVFKLASVRNAHLPKREAGVKKSFKLPHKAAHTGSTNIGFAPLDGHSWFTIQSNEKQVFHTVKGDARLRHVNPGLVLSRTIAKGLMISCGNLPLKSGTMLGLFTGVYALEKNADYSFGAGPESVVTNYAFTGADCMPLDVHDHYMTSYATKSYELTKTESPQVKPFHRVLFIPRMATDALPAPHSDTQSLANVRVPDVGVADFGALFNHSDTPNCEVQRAIVDGHLVLVIYTLRDLEPFEEAVIHYGYNPQVPSEHRNADEASTVVQGGHDEVGQSCFSKAHKDELFTLGNSVKSAFDAMGQPLDAALYGPPVEVKTTIHSTGQDADPGRAHTLVVDTSHFPATDTQLKLAVNGQL